MSDPHPYEHLRGLHRFHCGGCDFMMTIRWPGEAEIPAELMAKPWWCRQCKTAHLVHIRHHPLAPDAHEPPMLVVKSADRTDTDGSGKGDACDAEDGVDQLARSGQADVDKDGLAEACDPDAKAGILDEIDNSVLGANLDQSDTNPNRIGEACDGDMDGDEIASAKDNYPSVADPEQLDTDDAKSNLCDQDDIPDDKGNCPLVANKDQGGTDQDGKGTASDAACQSDNEQARVEASMPASPLEPLPFSASKPKRQRRKAPEVDPAEAERERQRQREVQDFLAALCEEDEKSSNLD